jgi:uncharacterized delta-60 repeat protein
MNRIAARFRTVRHFAPLALLLIAALPLASANADGLAPDQNFRPPSFARVMTPERALLMPDGKYFLLFDPETLTDQATGPITRFLPDGTLDSSFSFSRDYKMVSAAADAGNGKIYVSATRYLYGILDAEQILRLNNDGSIDPTFAVQTVGGDDPFPEVWQLLVQPDGRLLVAGNFLTFAGNDARDGIVGLNTDGTVDSNFVPVTIDGFVYSVALQSDGKILIGGVFDSVNGVADPGIARLNANGSLDSSFQANGFTRNTSTARVRGIVLQPDGLILLSGAFRVGTGNPPNRMPVVRLNTNGSIDLTFTSTGVVTSLGTGREIFLQPDGKVVVAVNGSVYRLNTNGSNDSSFHQPVTMNAIFDPPTSAGTPVTVQRYSDGHILLGGIFTDVDPPGSPNFAHFGVVRLNADGTVDSTLVSSHRTGVEVAPSAFARLTDGSTLVTFGDKIDPAIPYNVARLLDDGSRDPNFTLSSSDPSRFLANGFGARGLEPLPDGNFFVYGLASTGAPVYGKIQPNGAEDTNFGSNHDILFAKPTVAPDGKIVGAAEKDAQITLSYSFARLQADGHVDSFAVPSSIHDSQVQRDNVTGVLYQMYVGSRVLAFQSDGKTLIEYFSSDQRFHFVRLNADGSFDGPFTETTFSPPDVAATASVVFDPVTGGLAQPTVWSASYSLLDAYVQADGHIIVVGHFTSYGNANARSVVRLNSNGAVDNTFNAGGGAQWLTTVETSRSFPTVENIEAQSDGKLVITGNFEAFNGVAAPGIARLITDGSVDTSFVAPANRDKRSRVGSGFERQSDGSFLLAGPYSFQGGPDSRSLIRLTPGAPGAVNISTRLGVGTGENVLIEGFIVQGPAGSSKKILVRAIGPSLSQFGVADALANPTLEIHDGTGALVAANNDWKTTQVGGVVTGDQFAEINASGAAPGNDLESALIVALEPGNYTAVVRGFGDTVGTGVVDAFDLDSGSAARLANIATRGLVQPGDQLMIAGFIVQNGAVKLVVRAIGPSLGAFGVSNALPDTTLQLRDQQGAIVLENDDWKSSQQQELESIGLQPSHDLEAAVVATIQPGQYTAQVRGKGNDSGIGVVQVYFLQ